MTTKKTTTRCKNKVFRTADGFTLYLVGQHWIDNFDADFIDLMFRDDDGHPVTDAGERVR